MALNYLIFDASDDGDGVGAVGPEDADGARRADAVGVEEEATCLTSRKASDTWKCEYECC